MKKILLVLFILGFTCGCGKVSQDNLMREFVDKVESSKAYTVDAEMEIYNAEDTFKYDLKVSYMDDDYFKVSMINKVNNHDQIILRDSDSVYVITPSLNKSYKFASEWPYNSSQSYILTSLVRDIKEDSNVSFQEEEDGYSLRVSVNYPNNSYLKYEKLIFDKDKKLKTVLVYDEEDIVSIKVDFKKIDYKANLSKDDFDIEKIISDNCCNTDDNDSEETSALEDIIYPLYVPTNTYLKTKDTVNTENGERVILTFNGDKNFVLIEEASNVFSEFETIPVYGDPLFLSSTIGALSSNSLSWSVNNVDYYLTSKDLTVDEIKQIADSMGTASVMKEK